MGLQVFHKGVFGTLFLSCVLIVIGVSKPWYKDVGLYAVGEAPADVNVTVPVSCLLTAKCWAPFELSNNTVITNSSVYVQGQASVDVVDGPLFAIYQASIGLLLLVFFLYIILILILIIDAEILIKNNCVNHKVARAFVLIVSLICFLFLIACVAQFANRITAAVTRTDRQLYSVETGMRYIKQVERYVQSGWMVTVVATVINLVIVALSIDSLVNPETS